MDKIKGTNKKIFSIKINDLKLDLIDLGLSVLLVISLLATFSLSFENDKLLKQVNELDGKYNEINYQYDLLNNAYEELKEDYEYAIDIMRTSDRYSLPEGWEE